MGQTIGHYTLLTDIDLSKVSRESIFFRSDRKLFQATASLQENDFFSEFEFVCHGKIYSVFVYFKAFLLKQFRSSRCL